MNKRSLNILEYNKIIDMLTDFASSSMGKQLCKTLQPQTEIVTITSMQEETRDALSRIYKHGGLSFVGLTDIGPSLKRLEVEAALTTTELLDIARVLQVASHVKQYGENTEENHEADTLDGSFSEIMPLESLRREIRRCILSPEDIADDASSTLKSIRRTVKLTNDKLHNQLLSIVNSQNNKTLLQDALITMRNGRYCIPVKQEYKGMFPGMIHDQSSSGSTVFIEPMSVVNLNNELKELANKEAIEIEKILADLSAQVAFEVETLKSNVAILTNLDFIFARASFAKSYNGSQPLFNTDGIIDIKQGRHPLLEKHSVVPIDIRLGDEYSMLIITGPNTGGKTVSLKTLGLFCLMGQSGLHLPAFEGSRLNVFTDVFADIGDEQSIEQSLSTFSSHMTKIVSILKNATPSTLVLFDELGGGTDPTEGAALAISILSNLHNQDIRCMATTHYSELKTFALSTDGIENACCEFDVASLRPTYKLLIGIPGKSNAFAISKKLGLPDYIIEDAKLQIDNSAIDFEALIEDLEKSKLTIEAEKAEIEKYKQETLALKNQLSSKQDNLDAKKAEILRAAREEAREILEEAKEFADESIRKYNKWNKNPGKANNKAMEAERTNVRTRLNKVSGNLEYKAPNRKATHKPSDFHLGDNVKVLTLNTTGTVNSLPNSKGDLYVQMGILRSLVNIKDLEIVDEPTLGEETLKKFSTSRTNGSMMKSATIKPEINLLGMNTDEAISELDKYLDDAYISKLTQVTIIHGKGTGALRKAVHAYLKKQKNVKSFRMGEFGEGEAGVTIVEL